MAANPGIISVLGSKSASDLLIQALIENTGLSGLVKLKGYNKSTGVCVEDPALSVVWGVPATTNPYISQLFFLANVYKMSAPLFSTGCLGAFNCLSGENWDLESCGYWNTSPSSSVSVDIGGVLGVNPEAVVNSALTPGNGSITANWSAPGNAPIFAYWIRVRRVSDSVIIAEGWVQRTNVVISNLTNGVQYTVTVRSISDDGYLGLASSLNATPVAPPCPVLQTNLTVV